MSGENKEELEYSTNKVLLSRWRRSAVCGSIPFIPDSEYTGDVCELTCNLKVELE